MLDVNDNLDDSSNYGTVGDDASRARYGIVFLEIPSPAGLNRLHVHKSKSLLSISGAPEESLKIRHRFWASERRIFSSLRKRLAYA